MTRWQRFKHDWLGWHRPADNAIRTFDGATVISRCLYCRQRIGQDSQGNWFAFERQYEGGGEDGADT